MMRVVMREKGQITWFVEIRSGGMEESYMRKRREGRVKVGGKPT